MKMNFLSILMLVCGMFLLAACFRKEKEAAPVSNLDNLTVTPSMKGWELYSWPEGNTWKFSFLIGTNRIKSLSEVTSANGAVNLIRVTGVDSAKMVLNKFPEGEAITLIGQGWLQNAWGGQYGSLQLPPHSIIDELKSFSTQKKLTLSITN
jgi:hypothetical protein